MGRMFEQADAFNQDISNWDTSNVTLMDRMFAGADNFDQDLSDLEITSVTDMTGMLNETGLSIDNYNATLQGWLDQVLANGGQPTGLNLGASSLIYSPAGDLARQELIDQFGWTFSGDQFDSDGDGRGTENDLDDDNDGILDVDEDDATVISAPSSLTETFTHDNISNSVTFSGPSATAEPAGFTFNISSDNASVGDTFTVDFADPVFNTQFNFSGLGGLNGATIGNVSVTLDDGTVVQTALSGGFVNFESVAPSKKIDSITFELTSVNTDTAGLTASLTPTVLGVDTDRDGIRDSRDLDSDNDGITDLVEAQTTSGFIAPSGQGDGITDANNNGVDDNFGSGFTPVDTDGDGIADFRDSDSDDDGIDDIVERGDGGPTSVSDLTDTDRDGLLDIFEGAETNDFNDTDGENLDGSGDFSLEGDTRLNGDGSNANSLTLDLEFRDVNDAPTTTPIPTVDIDPALGTSYTFSVSDFGFSDPNDPTPNAFQSITIDSLPTKGTLTLSGVPVVAGQVIPVADIPNLTYDSGAFSGTLASFFYRVTDDGGTTGPTAVANPANDTSDVAAFEFRVLCFASGTMIQTSRGDVAVEDIAPGDLVRTLDHGFQPVRWMGARHVSFEGSIDKSALKPIVIRAGALGAGIPSRDLRVSPQHRVLIQSNVAERMFGTREVLIPAKKLIGIPGIEVEEEAPSVVYFHMLFETHQVVMADGAWSESLFTGPEALKALQPEAIKEIATLFPQITCPNFNPQPARQVAEQGRRVSTMVARHLKNAKSLVDGVERVG